MANRRKFRLKLLSGTLILGERTLLMGVLNVTPDSFSDGGKFFDARRAMEHAQAMESAGADILDIGGESTRPGAAGTSAEEQLLRILPVLHALRGPRPGLGGRLKIPISIDTQKAEVAEAALAAGAEMINDVSGLKHDPRIAEVAARHGAALILMHMRGEPRTMQKKPFAREVMKDVMQGLRASIAKARKAGVAKSQIIIDPGIGFGKSSRQNYELIARLAEFAKLGYPVLVGTSRKAFLDVTLESRGKPAPPEERIWGTAATVAASILHGAHIVRVHDVAEMAQVARAANFVVNQGKGLKT